MGFFLSYCRKQSWDNGRCYFRQCCGTPWIYNLKRIIHSLLLVTDYMGKHWTADQAILHLKKWNIALSKVVSLVQRLIHALCSAQQGDFLSCWTHSFFLYLCHTILSPSSVHMCMHASVSLVWLFVTSWTVARQAPLSLGFFRQEYWSGSSFPSPGDLPNPGIEPVSPALAGRFFIHWTTWEDLCVHYLFINL